MQISRWPYVPSGQALASHCWGPEFASRSLHVGLIVDETGFGQIFLQVSPRFPVPQISFHRFSTLMSSNSFHFINPFDGAIGTLVIHRPSISGLHHISSLNLALCRTQVEDVLCKFQNSNAIGFEVNRSKVISRIFRTCIITYVWALG